VGKDTSLKRYEKNALLRFFGLFLGAFMLMFLLLGSLYYPQEKSRLTKELEITEKMNYISCMQLQMEDCKEKQNLQPNLEALNQQLFYALGLVLLIFIPISLALSLFAIKPVRQASTMIDNFIANIVHDINTPIATIMLNVKSLLKRLPQQPKKLQRILSSSQQLSDMQHDLLALADEKEEIEFQKIDVKEVVEEIIEGFKLQYPQQPFHLQLQPQIIIVNRVDFRRIVQNLISNAVKYNRDNNPINIYNEKSALQINDQGKGMAHPEKVFEKNYREDYTIQGNGLGLASVLAMLKRNKITIEVQSKLNVGTEVKLSLNTNGV
jgi:two-component system OmpR family sensor kinase